MENEDINNTIRINEEIKKNLLLEIEKTNNINDMIKLIIRTAKKNRPKYYFL